MNGELKNLNHRSCWTRICGRGHTYEGVAHFDYCPECYKEIPDWAKEIMRIKHSAQGMPSGCDSTRKEGGNNEQ